MSNNLINPDVSKLVPVFREANLFGRPVPGFQPISNYNAALSADQQTQTDVLTQVYHGGQPIVRLSPFPVSANPSANAAAASTAKLVATSVVQTTINNLPKVVTPNLVQAQVDFGFHTGGEGSLARTTVLVGWVTVASIIVCGAAAETTVDHDPDDAIVEGLIAYAENLVSGLSFDIVCYAPQNSWGRYLINAIGA